MRIGVFISETWGEASDLEELRDRARQAVDAHEAARHVRGQRHGEGQRALLVPEPRKSAFREPQLRGVLQLLENPPPIGSRAIHALLVVLESALR